MNEALKPDVAERAAPTIPTPPGPLEPEAPPPSQRPPPRRRVLVRIGLVVALAVAAVFGWQRFEKVENSASSTTEGPNASRSGQAPQTVRVAPVTLGGMPITIDALGTVTPFETVTIRTQIAGKLQELGFEEGQTVKKGDFLAQIDPRPYQAALAQAQGQLAKDQALLGQAQSDLSRYEALSKQDSISKQQVADQEALVAQDKAAIVTDQAQVQTAQLNLDYTHIVSPITGRAGLRLVDPGNYLQPSDANGIVVVTQIDPISVVFATPEDNLPRIAARLNAGAKLPVTVFDRANVNQLAMGTLTTYDSQVDVTTGTIKMRATFDNPNGVLFPQQFVNVRLLVDTLTGVALAPNAAVQIGPSGNFVYVLNADSTVSRRDVVTGPSDGTRTTITSGLAAGDKVVIDGVDRLRDGAKVTVAAAAPGGTVQGPEAQGQAQRRSFGGAGAGPDGGDAQGHRQRHGQAGQAAGGDSAPATNGVTAPAATPAPGAAQ
ncbi:MAG: MdtA/MuxA family multidrug efflux RND transporter periplasmic adaptor subunit [Hyphomicrobiales bacterium]|nr:MdtA/MuxA family multidrug efflux RND transporter periplasmic adaptor subunit [Hyphomicrobiales bacterium]MBV8441215.1 MdtA/MuxA family multidrug efflux RND transporter periplasmic adaptor subunit [Hyphomicrobiales bacterium]